MTRRLFSFLLCAALVLSLAFPVLAADGNMDGDGGDMGGGTGGNSWSPGNDGVRITVINKETKQAVGNSFDRTNITPPAGIVSFAKRNKLQYISGANLAPNASSYAYKAPSTPLPQIISPSASSNIAAVKSYFTDENIVKQIAKDASISYDTLISGDFTIMIEPIAYFKFNGIYYAMTATEAALYDRLVNGQLRAAMGFLTHQNQPLAMFLENSELGITAWTGGGGVISDDNILSYLGIGTVNFGDDGSTPPAPVVDTFDYEYRADTDVITSVRISTSREITPDRPGRATFNLPTGSLSKDYVIPASESQLVWVKWHTPDVDTTTYYDVPVSISGGTGATSLRIKIISITENTPPNPEGRDRNDGFTLKPHPPDIISNSLSWGEWWSRWHPDWVYYRDVWTDGDGDRHDDSYWEDEGWWDFFWSNYSASLAVTAKTEPDERVPTANGNTMKSGYGINANVQVNMNTNGGSGNTTEVQHIIAVFPEFDYTTYNRWLVPQGGSPGYNAVWEFKSNEYSQFSNPVHFTPIWYPDAKQFPVTFTVLDAWTPAGQLMYVVIVS